MFMPSVTELLILGVIIAAIFIAKFYRPKQTDPTKVKNLEKQMHFAMFFGLIYIFAAYVGLLFDDWSTARSVLPMMLFAQVVVYERAKRAIQALKQENASLKSGLASLGPQQNSEGIVEGSK